LHHLFEQKERKIHMQQSQVKQQQLLKQDHLIAQQQNEIETY
jgi:hypothetical protein